MSGIREKRMINIKTKKAGVKMLKNKRGQSVLEYVIIFTVVVGAIVAFAILMGVGAGGDKGLGALFKNAGGKITDSTGKLPGVDRL